MSCILLLDFFTSEVSDFICIHILSVKILKGLPPKTGIGMFLKIYQKVKILLQNSLGKKNLIFLKHKQQLIIDYIAGWFPEISVFNQQVICIIELQEPGSLLTSNVKAKISMYSINSISVHQKKMRINLSWQFKPLKRWWQLSWHHSYMHSVSRGDFPYTSSSYCPLPWWPWTLWPPEGCCSAGVQSFSTLDHFWRHFSQLDS